MLKFVKYLLIKIFVIFFENFFFFKTSLYFLRVIVYWCIYSNLDLMQVCIMILKNIMTALLVCIATVSLANQWHDEADRCWNEAHKYKKERNYKQAIEYLKRAVIAERKNENPRSEELIAQLNELGQIYDSTAQYEKALHYFKLMLSACQKYSNKDQEALALNSIGRSYFNLNRVNEAMDSYREALAVSRKNGYKDKMVMVLDNMATAYRGLPGSNHGGGCSLRRPLPFCCL